MRKRATYISGELSGVRSVDRFGDIHYVQLPLSLMFDAEIHIMKAESSGCLLALYIRATPKARPFCPYGYFSETADVILGRVERAASGGLGIAQLELFRYYANLGPVHLARGSLPLFKS